MLKKIYEKNALWFKYKINKIINVKIIKKFENLIKTYLGLLFNILYRSRIKEKKKHIINCVKWKRITH